jgi:23S rRNA pseudouridine1911/1915/1917 synthase
MPLALLHADAVIVVVDKPAGVVVHPGAGQEQGTLVHGLIARYPELAVLHESRPGIVHRLDRDTSGVMVVARTEEALDNLQRQFAARTVEKVYLAAVAGHLPQPEAIIDAPIGRDRNRRKTMAATIEGREARTAYRVVGESAAYTLVEVRPLTGRTHQIRVHFAAIGHPVVGDRTYGRGGRASRGGRLALHAWRLSLDHPSTGQRVTFEAPVPADLTRVLAELGLGASITEAV